MNEYKFYLTLIVLFGSLLIIIFTGAFGYMTDILEGTGMGLRNIYTIYNSERIEISAGGKEVKEDYLAVDVVISDAEDASSGFSAVTNKMLKWVGMCESSGRHEDIWGRAGEYGILQFKEESFYWLSERYNFTGDWKNRDDQLALFLLTSEEDKYKHWSCFRKYQQTK